MIVDLNRLHQQTAACSGCRQPAPHNMGAISWPSFDLTSIDWKWVAAAVAIAFLVWKFTRNRKGGSERRRQLRLARAKYQMELAK